MGGSIGQFNGSPNVFGTLGVTSAMPQGVPQGDTKIAPYDPNRILPPNYQQARNAFQQQQATNFPMGQPSMAVVGNDQFGQQFGYASDADAFNQFYNQNYGAPVAASTTPTPRFLPSEPITPGTPDPKASQIDESIRPFLTEGLKQAQEIFLRQQPSFFPGQTYVNPSQASQEALAAQEQIARSVSPSLAVGQGAYLQSAGGLSQTAGGGFLQGNPYQQQMMQAAARPLQQAFTEQVLPGISSLYSKSGRLGSGSMERALGQVSESYGRALGDITANLAGNQYQAERQLQQQAQLGLTNIAQAAPQIYGQQYLPAQQLAQVGAQQEAIAAQPLQEAMTRYAYGQRLPYEQLSGYLSSVYGSPLGSYGTSAQQLPQASANRTTGALAGGLAGGLGGYALGSAFPSIGGTTGAVGGAALGGLLGYGF